MVKMCREKRKREATKIINWEEGRKKKKKEVRYFLSDLLLRIDSAVTSVLRLSTLRSLPSHFITRRHFRFNFFPPIFLLSFGRYQRIRTSAMAYHPVFSFSYSKKCSSPFCSSSVSHIKYNESICCRILSHLSWNHSLFKKKKRIVQFKLFRIDGYLEH